MTDDPDKVGKPQPHKAFHDPEKKLPEYARRVGALEEEVTYHWVATGKKPMTETMIDSDAFGAYEPAHSETRNLIGA